MKPFVRFRHVSQFFLEREIFENKLYRKSRDILCSGIIFFKSCPLWNNIEKYKSGKATDHNSVKRMCTACWVTEATQTRLSHLVLTVF